uniref:Protein kinase domain-containing protein n=1 Tax=Oryza nivara TaxID=4536 RepID=A0A0E0GZL6_ORYNI
MKEVEMALHFLHSKINVVEQSNNESHPLQQLTRPPHHKAMTIDTGNKAILESSSCCNLEGEFMSSARYSLLVLVLLPMPTGGALAAPTLDGCNSSCGNLTFAYPFGIGQECFLNPDFELICHHGDNTHPPSLFLQGSSLQVVEDIVVRSSDDYNVHGFGVNMSDAIPVVLGVDVYNYTWTSPESFLLIDTTVKVVGCDMVVYYENKSVPLCTLTCPNKTMTEADAMMNCNGTGCCKFSYMMNKTMSFFQLQFVRSNETVSHSVNSSLWNSIQLRLYSPYLEWSIDQPSCSTANACQKANCSRLCGHVSVPYPFGLEEGCFARELFHLNCTDANSTLRFDDYNQVTDIKVEEGVVMIKHDARGGADQEFIAIHGEPNLYDGSGDYSISVGWAVANLTCPEAKQNASGYACVSTNSNCVHVNSTSGYVGYRCNCSAGFQGNPYIQNGCTGGIAIGLGGGIGILLLSLSVTFLIRKKRSNRQRQLRKKYFQKNQGLLLEQLISSDETATDHSTKIFSLEELKMATNNFNQARVLGSGGHGTVYKGILSDKRVVAIKKPNTIKKEEISQFINEVAILSRINHRNIVKLFGCCLETDVPLLVYDFVPNGSLNHIIHADPNNREFSLSWANCLRIATETAGALYYLHSAASISVFHRDVKSSNILLDANYTAKVSDFGSSRLISNDQTHVSTNIQGTFGYLDPEYYYTGRLNEKSDMYSFGIVLLELLLRKQAIFKSGSDSLQNLSIYFLSEITVRSIMEIAAPEVLEEATEDEMNNVASIAQACLRLRGEERPTMKHVELALQSIRDKGVRADSAADRNHDIQPVQSKRYLHRQALGVDVNNLANMPSASCYSLEQEFLLSANLAR